MRRTNPFEPLEPIEPAEPLSFHFDEFILWISHLELFHRLQLMETVARLDALDEILIRGGLIDEVDRCLIDGEKVGRGEDADIRDRRLGSDETDTDMRRRTFR